MIRAGPLEIDVPRSIGYFGGIGAALALELIEPPLALFIAAIPFIKMLNSRRMPAVSRFFAQFTEGSAQPVGSSGEGTIRLADELDS